MMMNYVMQNTKSRHHTGTLCNGGFLYSEGLALISGHNVEYAHEVCNIDFLVVINVGCRIVSTHGHDIQNTYCICNINLAVPIQVALHTAC